MEALLAACQQDTASWLAFQQEVADLKLQRSRVLRERDALVAALDAAVRERDRATTAYDECACACKSRASAPSCTVVAEGRDKAVQHVVNIVMVTGFESFNVALYKQVGADMHPRC